MVVPRVKKQARKKVLDAIGWKRLSGPNTKRGRRAVRESREDARKLKKWDKTRNWPIFGDNLRLIEINLGVKISEVIRQRISGLPIEKNLSVLEAGCGPGYALGNLKKDFGQRVRTVGLVLKRTPKADYSGVDRLIEGSLIDVKPHERFDVIYGHSGAHFFEALKPESVQKTIEWLKPGGVAVVDLIDLFELNPEKTRKEIETVLMANGIKNWEFKQRTILVFTKPKRKHPI